MLVYCLRKVLFGGLLFKEGFIWWVYQRELFLLPALYLRGCFIDYSRRAWFYGFLSTCQRGLYFIDNSYDDLAFKVADYQQGLCFINYLYLELVEGLCFVGYSLL